MTKSQIFGAVIALLIATISGYKYAAALYSEDIAKLKEDYAKRTADLEAKYRAQEKESKDAIIKAWTERDKARANAIDLRADVDRLRIEADKARSSLSGTTDYTGNTCKIELSECTRLLERGASLLDRSNKMVQDVTADKDAIINMLK